jgi:hypothetical protein
MNSKILARTLVTLAVTAVLALATATSASADPLNPPNRGLIVTIHCADLGDLTAIQEGNGLWTRAAIPWHVLDSNLVLNVYAVHFEVTTPGGALTVLDATKPGHRSGRLDVCTQHDEDPAFGIFDGTYWVSYTPSG